MLAGAKAAVRSAVRAFGYDITSYRRQDSLVAHLRELLNVLQVNCVIDVGAHLGDYGSMLREIGYTHRIVSFEPVEATFRQLATNVAKDSMWQVHRMALGQKDGVETINVCEATNFSSFRLPNEYAKEQFGNMATISRTEEVPVRRLESVIAEAVAGLADPRVFLKIDTQGYDLDVLEGSGASLDMLLGVQTEISVRPIYEGTVGLSQALIRMKEMGLDPTGLYPVSRDDQLRVIEFDCVAVRSRQHAHAVGSRKT